MNIIILAVLVFLPVLSFADPARDAFERGLTVHEKLTDFIHAHSCELGMERDCDRPLTAQSLESLKQNLRDLEEWRRLAFEGIVPMAALGIDSAFKLTVGERLSLEERNIFNPYTFQTEKFVHVTLNFQESASRNFIASSRQGLANTLLLYDSYFRLAQLVSRAPKLRSILQYDMPEEGPYLAKTYALASDKALWTKTNHALEFFNELQKLDSPRQHAEERYFDQYILKSFVAQRMSAKDFDYRLLAALFMSREVAQGEFFEGINRLVKMLSQIFGNSAGTVQTRDGKLKALTKDPAEMARLKAVLQPLDILLEKTPMRLTDKFIPGFYGHVAIWLGTPEELQTLEVDYYGRKIPLLSHPDVLSHLEKMSQGKLIVEALRKPGVTMNTFEHFLDIDDLLVLKAPPMNENQKASHILKTIQQVGKPYDFNFDVMTEREIVCSELVYTVFTGIQWPTSRSAGRHTINPDEVAWKAVDSCFLPVLMFHDGKPVTKNMKAELRRLLELPGGIEYTPTGNCFNGDYFSGSNHPPQDE